MPRGRRRTSSTGPHELDRAAIGPRGPGGVYRSGYTGTTYRVDAVLYGDDARRGAAVPADVAVAVTDLDGPRAGLSRVHCTAWDARRDQVVTAAPELDPRLVAALAADYVAELRGMPPDERRTCFTCTSWADHAHDPLSGRRISEDEYYGRRSALGA